MKDLTRRRRGSESNSFVAASLIENHEPQRGFFLFSFFFSFYHQYERAMKRKLISGSSLQHYWSKHGQTQT